MNVHARTFMNIHSRKWTFEIGRHEEPVLYIQNIILSNYGSPLVEKFFRLLHPFFFYAYTQNRIVSALFTLALLANKDGYENKIYFCRHFLVCRQFHYCRQFFFCRHISRQVFYWSTNESTVFFCGQISRQSNFCRQFKFVDILENFSTFVD